MVDRTVEIDEGNWIDCWSCGGEGSREDCFEDCCVCLNLPCVTVICEICDGTGGWYEEDDDTTAPRDGDPA